MERLVRPFFFSYHLPMEITERFEVHADIADDLARELASRAVRFSVTKPKWWEFWKDPVFTVTGSGVAVQAIADEVQAMERHAWEDGIW